MSERISRLEYCQYLLSSQTNYTLTHMAEHVESASHDTINRYLRGEKLKPSLVWEHVKSDIVISEGGFLLFDDTILDKDYSREIEGVRWQYSGNAHTIIRGIGVVTCVYVNPETQQFWVIDYRIFDPERDGKTKLEHIEDMFKHTLAYKKLAFYAVLMDTWYAAKTILLMIHDAHKLFYCPIRRNRLVKEDDSERYYVKVEELKWDEISQRDGKVVRLRHLPQAFKLKLFRVPISSHRTDYIVTNDISITTTQALQQVYAHRWKIEQFHRELKQLTGVEQCQCRKQRIQRNHIACSMLVWVRLKHWAYRSKTTVYQIKKNLYKDYLMQQLKNPTLGMAFA